MLRCMISAAFGLYAAISFGQSFAASISPGSTARIVCPSQSTEVVLYGTASAVLPVVEIAHCGEQVSIIEQQDEWYKVQTQSGKEGYVRKVFIPAETAAAPINAPAKIAYVNCLFVGWKSIPLWPLSGGLGRSVAELSCGDKVDLLQEGGWRKIRTSTGQIGFVHHDFISLAPTQKYVAQYARPMERPVQAEETMPQSADFSSSGHALSVRVLQTEQVPYSVQYGGGNVSTHCLIGGTTNTSGTAIASGNMAWGSATSYSNLNMSCSSSETPSSGWRHVLNAMLVVASNNTAYIIACDAAWRWSKCKGLVPGDTFPARLTSKGLAVEYSDNGKHKEAAYGILKAQYLGH